MIQVKLKELIDNFGSLNALANTKMSMTPARLASKVLNKANEELKDFFERRKKLIEEFGEDSEEFNKEIDALREEDVVFPSDCKKLKLSRLRKADGMDIDIEPVHVMKLGWLIEDDLGAGHE